MYGQLILDMGLKIWNGAMKASLANGLGKIGQLHIKNIKPTLSNAMHKNQIKMN